MLPEQQPDSPPILRENSVEMPGSGSTELILANLVTPVNCTNLAQPAAVRGQPGNSSQSPGPFISNIRQSREVLGDGLTVLGSNRGFSTKDAFVPGYSSFASPEKLMNPHHS